MSSKMSEYDKAYDIAISALSCCAFDTVDQMNNAYDHAAKTIEAALLAERKANAVKAYEAVDMHLWDASVAGKIRDIIDPPHPKPNNRGD